MTIIMTRGATGSHPRCDVHQSPTAATLEIGELKIPLCRQCIKDLSKEVDKISVEVERNYTSDGCRVKP